MLRGTFTALITPFQRNGKFDRKVFRKLVEEQIAAGIDGLVAVGTTGESPTVTHEENLEIIESCIEIAAGRTRVIAGTGSNSTEEAILMTKAAARMGTDFSLLVCPYYNRPSQEGLFRHFRAIAEAVPELSHILYNIPGRTGVHLEPATVIRLSAIPNIIALKDATGSMADIEALAGRLPEYFSILSGDDGLTLDFIAQGASGVISVASNLRPVTVKAMVDAALGGDVTSARERHAELAGFFDACGLETNPVPIKTMLAMAGKCEEVFRLPLCEVSSENRKVLQGFV